MKKYIFGATLLLALPAFAQDQQLLGKSPDPTPEQVAVQTIQQQRNQALSRAEDSAATLAYMQKVLANERKYWDEYVKGLHPQPKKAEEPPKK